MGNIADRLCPEGSQPGPSFLGIDGRDGGGRHAQPLPQQHGRAVKQMAQQHAAQPEVAEQGNGIVVRLLNSVEQAFPRVTVRRQQRVKRPCHLIIFLPDAGFRKEFLLPPAEGVQQNRLGVQVLRQPVPGDGSVPAVQFRPSGRQVEFPQPVKSFGCAACRFQRRRDGILCPAHSGYIIAVHFDFPHPFSQQLYFSPAGFRQRVVFVVRISVPDNQQPHENTIVPSFMLTTPYFNPYPL